MALKIIQQNDAFLIQGTINSSTIKQFKNHLGCTPLVYQQQARLKKAAQLIGQGKQISQVCFSLGYSNLSHFSRNFKQFFGINPSAYKHQNLNA